MSKPEPPNDEEPAVGRYAPVDMSPEQFERFALRLFSSSPEVKNVRVVHREPVKGSDGEYIIDGTIRFTYMGMEFLVLLEAKLHKRPATRADVQVLRDKLQSVGAHKGIVASSAGFQLGALRYAKEHGIALVHIVDGAATYEAHARDIRLYPPGSMGFAAFRVYETERGYGFTRLDGQPEYLRDLLVDEAAG